MRPIKYIILSVFLFFISVEATAQWVPYRSASKGYVGENFKYYKQKLAPLHKSKNGKVGSILYTRNSAPDDRILILPDHFLMFMFTEQRISYWIVVKVVSKPWQLFMDQLSDWEKKPGIPFESPIQKELDSEAQAAFNQLFKQVKTIYGCNKNKRNLNKISTQARGGINVEALIAKFNRSLKKPEDALEEEFRNIKSFKAIVKDEEVYLVSPKTGTVFYRMAFKYQDDYRGMRNAILSANPKGFNIENGCIDLNDCKYGENIATLHRPINHITLSPQEKKYYEIDPLSINTLDPELPGEEIVKLDTSFSQLATCPGNLKHSKLFRFDSLSQVEINTYLFQGEGSNSLENWILFTRDRCYNCFEGQAGIYEPKGNHIRILETIDYRELDDEKKQKAKALIAENVKRAFKLMKSKAIKNNTLSFLGEEGFIYEKGYYRIVSLASGGLSYPINDVRLDPKTLNDWLERASRSGERWENFDPNDPEQSESAMQLFYKEVARGKTYWINRYYQSPAAFIAAYCKIIAP